jgi:hypothetical protein
VAQSANRGAAKSVAELLSAVADPLGLARPDAGRGRPDDATSSALLWSLLSLVAVAGVAAGGVGVRRLVARRAGRSAPPGPAQPDDPLVSNP